MTRPPRLRYSDRVSQQPAYDRETTNQLIHSMGVRFRKEILRPVGPSPTRLPVNQAFALAATHLFWTLPGHIRRFASRATPQGIAQRSGRLDPTLSPLSIWMFGYSFLVGREILLDLGAVKAGDHVEDIGLVLDCWNRCATAVRTDGHRDNSEAGWTNPYLPRETVRQLSDMLVPVDVEMRRVAGQFLAALESYIFLVNAEAYLGTIDSGPYPLSTHRLLIVRHFFDLTGRWYPWHDRAAAFPYPTCTLAFTLDPEEFQTIELSDRAALLTAPGDYRARIRELVLVRLDRTRPRPLPFTDLDRLTRAAKKTAPRILAWFQAQSSYKTILFCAQPWAVRPAAVVVPSEACFDWTPAPAALDLLSHYAQDDTLATRWVTARCLAPGRSSAFVPVED